MISNQIKIKSKIENFVNFQNVLYFRQYMHAHAYVMLRDLVREYQFVEINSFPGSVI